MVTAALTVSGRRREQRQRNCIPMDSVRTGLLGEDAGIALLRSLGDLGLVDQSTDKDWQMMKKEMKHPTSQPTTASPPDRQAGRQVDRHMHARTHTRAHTHTMRH